MTGRRVPRRKPRTGNYYQPVLERSAQGDLQDAAAAEGLDDEVALLRLLVRRELAAQPEDIRPLLQGLTLLVRAVATRHRISPADQEALEQRMAEALTALTLSLQRDDVGGAG